MVRKRALGFSPTVLRKKFGAGMTVRNYRDKEVIFSQGDTADAVFYIQNGTVKLTVVSTRRKKAIIAFLHRGSLFGEGCLGGQSLRICSARSIGKSNITRLRKAGTVGALKRDPQFMALFVAYLLSRIIRIEEDLVDQFFNFSERRLARVLLLLGHIIEESEPDCPLNVSQGTLAEMVGTTRARVSKFMIVFKKKGFVSYNGGLQVNSALINGFLKNRPMSVAKKSVDSAKLALLSAGNSSSTRATGMRGTLRAEEH
jgi:CRP/FNR family cyclic AMP-dependent transcriptional regulator